MSSVIASHWPSVLLAVLFSAWPCAIAAGQDLLPVVSAAGGTSFAQVCPAGHVLTGIRARRGDTLHGVGVRCRPVLASGTLGAEVDDGPVWGGPGGAAFEKSCATGAVIGQQTARHDGTHLVELRYQCFGWQAATRRWNPSDRRSAIVVLPTSSTPALSASNGTSTICPSTTRPADGVRGRSGTVVEAIGIRCDAP
jgi:hypothetical protein